MSACLPLSRRFPNAVIVYANVFQFGSGQKIAYPRVETRMVLWCKAGTGVVSVNGRRCEFSAGRYLLLPWKHAIQYEASADDPFLVAGVHLVPHHLTDHPVLFEVAHNDRHPVARLPWRQDLPIPEPPRLKLGWLHAQTPLTHLLEYVLQLFRRGNPEEWMARQLGRQLLCEMLLSEQRNEVHADGVPAELERMKQYILANLQHPLSLSHMVEFTGLSASTVDRLFREHLKTTPVAWIARTKMERARVLLRTQRLSVAEIGVQVGISDPYYFSKCFKKETGQSPLAYRRQARWL